MRHIKIPVPLAAAACVFYNLFVYLILVILVLAAVALAVVILLFLVGLCFGAICTICGEKEDEIDAEKSGENKETTEPNESTLIMN